MSDASMLWPYSEALGLELLQNAMQLWTVGFYHRYMRQFETCPYNSSKFKLS